MANIVGSQLEDEELERLGLNEVDFGDHVVTVERVYGVPTYRLYEPVDDEESDEQQFRMSREWAVPPPQEEVQQAITGEPQGEVQDETAPQGEDGEVQQVRSSVAQQEGQTDTSSDVEYDPNDPSTHPNWDPEEERIVSRREREVASGRSATSSATAVASDAPQGSGNLGTESQRATESQEERARSTQGDSRQGQDVPTSGGEDAGEPTDEQARTSSSRTGQESESEQASEQAQQASEEAGQASRSAAQASETAKENEKDEDGEDDKPRQARRRRRS